MVQADTADPTAFYLSYRSDDSPEALGRLVEELRQHFGPQRIVDPHRSSKAGKAGGHRLDRSRAGRLVILVIVGPHWLASPDDEGRKRLEERNDPIAEDLAWALATPRTRVIPILLIASTLSKPVELPIAIAEPALRNGLVLRQSHWKADVDRLLQALARAAENPAEETGATASPVPHEPRARNLSVDDASAGTHRQPEDLLEQWRRRQLTDNVAAARRAFTAGDYESALDATRQAARLADCPIDLSDLAPQLATDSGQSIRSLLAQVLRAEEFRRADHRSANADPLAREPSPADPARVEPDNSSRGHRVLDENVQFTVYRRSVVRPARWYPLLAFAHLAERRDHDDPDDPDPLEEVETQARQLLGGDAPAFRHVTADSRSAVLREGEIRFVPSVEGIEFNPVERRFSWRESVHREEFRMRASTSLDGRTARGALTVYAGSVLLADVPLSIAVDDDGATDRHERSQARPYRRIFASYSHRDAGIVQEFESYVESTGDRYLRDVVSLRTGEVWNERLLQMIEQADVFQLFWSWNAMASPLVQAEWQHALALRRASFVRPVYWEEPLPEQPGLPPPELRTLHFQRVHPRSVPQPPRSMTSRVRRIATVMVPMLAVGVFVASLYRGLTDRGALAVPPAPTLSPPGIGAPPPPIALPPAGRPDLVPVPAPSPRLPAPPLVSSSEPPPFPGTEAADRDALERLIKEYCLAIERLDTAALMREFPSGTTGSIGEMRRYRAATCTLAGPVTIITMDRQAGIATCRAEIDLRVQLIQGGAISRRGLAEVKAARTDPGAQWRIQSLQFQPRP